VTLPAEVEAAAAALLRGVPGYVWDGETLPVPVEEIADTHLGLLVRDVEHLAGAPGAPALEPSQSLSGLLLPDRGEIWVNASEGRQWPGRRRFTIAHEMGHWQLHRAAHDHVYCRATSVDSMGGSVGGSVVAPERPPLPTIEEEANAFAAAVLMPAPLICAAYADYGSDFARLCEVFGASGAAMGRRLQAVIPQG